MKPMTTPRLLALLAVLALPACDEGAGPLADDLTLDEAAELTVLEDSGSLEVAFELTEVTNDVAASLGEPGYAQGRVLNAQARARFFAAREAAHAGDRRRALELARRARREVAEALVATGGEEAVVALIERIEELVLTLDTDDDDVFDNPEALKDRLEKLIAEARARLDDDDLVGAAERALLGEQLIRFHRGFRDHRGDVAPERARLAVELAATAVDLAERPVNASDTPVRNVGSSDVRKRMNRWLVHAKRMLGIAERALQSGHYARAVHFAWHAQWSALKAVVLPGGITEEELRAMDDLANKLYEQARTAVGDDPTELEQRLLGLAGRLIERGEEMLEQGYKRGVAALWRAAVISSWLIG